MAGNNMPKTKDVDESSVINLEEVNEVWKVLYKGAMSQETILVLADSAEMALRKALIYQQGYTIICDWPITSLERISTTVI